MGRNFMVSCRLPSSILWGSSSMSMSKIKIQFFKTIFAGTANMLSLSFGGPWDTRTANMLSLSYGGPWDARSTNMLSFIYGGPWNARTTNMLSLIYGGSWDARTTNMLSFIYGGSWDARTVNMFLFSYSGPDHVVETKLGCGRTCIMAEHAEAEQEERLHRVRHWEDKM